MCMRLGLRLWSIKTGLIDEEVALVQRVYQRVYEA